MKIQYLTVIFIIIILPISILLNAYTQNQLKTLDLQILYDSKLNSATYDAIKAFQLNTINSSTSDLANSKMRDIEASVNTFFNTISSNFNMAGYNSDILKEYVPALVYTLYDGYYIYSPFRNTLTETEVQGDGKKIYGLKPYVYYSCRYKKGELDVVITYSLDNYITVQGKDKNGKGINKSGCLINNINNVTENSVKYREITIEKEPYLREYVALDENLNTPYKYIKINGVKYYQDRDGSWFSLINGEKYKQPELKNNQKDDSAYLYYKEAYEFREWLDDAGILELRQNDAVIDNKQEINGFNSNSLIFNYEESDGTSIEEPNSLFNEHRLAVIRYSIEKNLSIAIANYNDYGDSSTANFQMPKLKESEWDKVLNNVCMISFLQGLNIGGKVYNGYSIITNNQTEEFVAEESIYIGTRYDNGTYYQIWDETISKNSEFSSNNYIGIFNIDLRRRAIMDEYGNMKYYYPKKQLGSYTSIVNQTSKDIDYDDNVYKYLDGKNELAKVYYTALGRERYGMYKVERNAAELLANYTSP